MRIGFGLNTNLVETNILNLAVVLGIVVTVIGDALKNLLNERRIIILSILQEASKKEDRLEQQLREARKAVEMARSCAREIRAQSLEIVEKERSTRQEKLKIDLQRFKERGEQAIKVEQQRAKQVVAKRVTDLALERAQNSLVQSFGKQGNLYSKQKDLNNILVNETFSTLSLSLVTKSFLLQIA